MRLFRAALAALSTALLVTSLASAGEPVDWDAANQIRDEGLRRSEVMETLSHLTDEIGPRLTASPQGQQASEWTKEQLADWGLSNAHLEGWGPFGRGWSFSRSTVHMLSPFSVPLMALPKAWTPGTKKARRGEAMRITLESEEDFEKHRGELKDKILFLSAKRDLRSGEDPPFTRKSSEDLEELAQFKMPSSRSTAWRDGARKRTELRKKINEFLVEEKVLATVDVSSRDGGTLRLGGGGSRQPGESVGVPALVMAVEQYNQVLRHLDAEKTVELEIDVRTEFHDDDLMAYNTIAEIPGSDLADEVVLLGAHLDSWHPGTGSNDNGAGCAVMMEAMRILKVLDLKPRRTIRIALWTGEEQGLFGSRAYVESHLATRPEQLDEDQLQYPAWLRDQTWPIQPLPGHEKFSAYFNLDNGSGKLRGIYAQSNLAVVPIFEAWLEPFHDLGADRVVTRNTGGTDHMSFDAVGLPGFQFIQDGLDYFTRTHHTNLDVLDHAIEDDLKQASVVVASFAYHAAMRDEKLPRKPLPREPKESKEKQAEASEAE